MKKIKDSRFLCIDFVNSNPFQDKTIEGLIKTFIFYLKEKGEKFDERSLALQWKEIVRREIEELKRIQDCMKQFIEYSISKSQTSTESDENFRKAKNLLLSETEKYHYPQFEYLAILERDFNVVKNLMVPGLCYHLIEFDRENYWDRVIYCKQCHKIFIRKTDRSQKFCSDRCRFRYHNKEKVRSGEHRAYMRNWRAERAINSVNTKK